METKLNETKELLTKLERESSRLFGEKEVDTMIDTILHTDAMLFSPGMPPLKGKEAQRELFHTLAATEGLHFSWEPTDVEVSPANEMAWVYGTFNMQAPDGSTDSGKYVSVWKNEGEDWKNVAEIRNSNEHS